MKKDILWVTDGHSGNYVDKVLKKARGLKPGEFAEFNIAHDDWCLIWTMGRCTCNPDVSRKAR